MGPWSYSMLTSFETCPKRHFHTRIAKDFVEADSEHLRWGNAVHEALELRVKTHAALPVGMRQWEPLVQRILSVPGEVTAERSMALDRSFAPVDFWDPTAWVRGKLDLIVATDEKALILDWKTGARKFDNDQLRLFAALSLQGLGVSRVDTGFVWLKDKKVDKARFYSRELPEIWGGFLPRVNRLEAAHEHNRWEAKPSGLCRKWCPVKSCEFCGSR